MYDCRFLPSYAQYLMEKHLDEFSKEMLVQSRTLGLPLMNRLAARYTDEEIFTISRETSKHYLQLLSMNKARRQVALAMERWRRDELEVVNKMDVDGRDITVLNHLRGQALKKFLPVYTNDTGTIMAINSEIDFVILGNITSAMDIYIDILKSEVFEQSNFSTKLIKASPAVTFLFDLVNHKQLFVSGSAYDVTGYLPEEILGMDDAFLVGLTHPDDRELLQNNIDSLMREGTNETRQVEYRFRHKDGMYRWLRMYEVIFKKDAEGNPVEMLAKTFEITHEKEIAMALQKREQQLLEAQSIAHIGSFEWIIPNNESTNSEELYRIFEMDKSRRYDEFMNSVHPDDQPKVEEALRNSFTTGQYECEFRYLVNGKEKMIWSLGKVEFIDGNPYRMVGIVQDISTFKKLERELVEKTNELAATNESLRQFAFIASHDMKEPLRKIMMFAELVMNAEKEKISEKSLGQLQKMQHSSRNLYTMIEDILSFSLLEAKQEKENVNLDALVASVKDLLEETIKEKQARIIANNLPEAWVIRPQIRQLFQNLVSNSLKFSRDGEAPEIVISGAITSSPAFLPPKTAPKYLEVTVQDNGIGFPEEAKEKIFELFNRIHPRSQYEGTGLGLSISRRIIDNHNGSIKAFPGAGKGARFVFVIPQ